MPPFNARYFVGRDEDLKAVHKLLQLNERVSISAIQGMGGIGKTELAKHYAAEYQDEYPDGIAWLSFGAAGIAEEIVNFGRSQLKLSLQGEDIKAKVAEVWSQWDIQSGALVIVDNLNRTKDYGAIKSLLPQGNGVRVLLTSRVRFGNVPAHNLEVLDLPEAVASLETLAGASERQWDHELAKKLCDEKLGCLPLAITLVGCYLANDPGLTLIDVLRRLKKKGLDSKPLNPTDDSVAEEGVRAAIELTWDVLEADVRKFAVFLSMFACAPMEWRLVEAALGEMEPDDAEDWRGELLRYSLLETTEIEEREAISYKFHPLVWEYLREKVPTMLNAQTCQTMVKAIITEAETIEYNAPLADYDKIRPSIPHIIQVAEKWTDNLATEDVVTPCTRLATYYKGLADSAKGEFWAFKNIDLAKTCLSENHPEIAVALNNLAEFYRAQGKYAKAEPLYQEALVIAREALPANHPQLAIHLNNLANLCNLQEKYSEAESLYQEALVIDQEALPSNHPQLASHLNNLANLYHSQEKYAEAESLHQEVLAIKKEALPANHLTLAISLNNLAASYSLQGKYAEAEPLYKEALAIAKESLPANHPDFAAYTNNLARLYQAQEKYKEAEPLFQKALAILEESLGLDHPNTYKVRSYYEDFLRQKENET
ncbi:Tetratricopeptide TPR_1 repeat-containing protein [[Leptolyngbya] sp. PCC 7376]|uniref:tetratricopeptide repeat protein n=1 Tax=[Leptolyngbya] sp. PCC 7376 TaxID=111781 RepID=UPI00029F1AF9|nr:tetratricopeptide repeat protein [[Leptolyngbya] sp. PCC 7376]AFY38894.1 Tetratricopeptide TPR_1 repeat-containing protein [[Leptolyngbya] sp. PCC 7376]